MNGELVKTSKEEADCRDKENYNKPQS